MKLSEELQARGFVHQHTGESLEEITDEGKRTVYLGVDPTADSLHVGHLVTYLLVRRLADAGWKVILLVGGGTGLIGDPRDTEERPLISESEVEENAQKLSRQVEKLIGVEVSMVNNATWLRELNLLAFLRDIGKHFTVNSLIKKETMHERLKNESPLSYTEFAYPLLQAYDYMQLHREHGCDVQVGGSDQWGNITAGVELIRKKHEATVHGITVPLVVDKKSGRKFGKSEGNAVWLDDEKTSPFDFYQFWLGVDDESVESYLKLYTLLTLKEVDEKVKEHNEDSKKRVAQRTLAWQVTEIVHGRAQADALERVSDILFGSKTIADLDALERDILRESAPTCPIGIGEELSEVLVRSGLAESKRAAREHIEKSAVELSGEKVSDPKHILDEASFHEGLALLKRGKRNVCVLVRS